jgi:ferritin-like metal-binding protein YciE
MKNTGSKSAHMSTEKQSNGNQSNPNEKQELHDLLVSELKHIYWGEKELTKAIPKMIENATSEELINALTSHLKATKEHVTRLEKAFSLLEEKAEATKCIAIEGLLKAAEGTMEKSKEDMVMDASIILAGQKVEHYEIATYSNLCSFAKTLGEDAVASLLQETLNDENEANEKLSEISESIESEITV